MNKDTYLFHEGCDYQLAIRDVQMRFGALLDPICPDCDKKTHRQISAVPRQRPKGRALRRNA